MIYQIALLSSPHGYFSLSNFHRFFVFMTAFTDMLKVVCVVLDWLPSTESG